MIVFFTTIDVVAPDIYHYIQYHLFGFPNGRGKKEEGEERKKIGGIYGYTWLWESGQTSRFISQRERSL